MNNNSITKMELNIDDSFTISQRVSHIIYNLERHPDFYLHNDVLTYARVGRQPIICVDYTKTRIALYQYFEFYRYKKIDKELVPSYRKLPDEIVEVLVDEVRYSSLKKIELIATHDIVLEKSEGMFQLASLGYNESSKFFVTKILTTRTQRRVLTRALETFCYKNQVDLINLIGILLTKYFHHLFPGAIPLVRIEANQRNLGKTLLAIIISLVYQGKIGEMLTLSDNEEELLKHMCAVASNGDSVIVFDNVKSSKNLKEIGGAGIEKLVSSPVHQYRILGTNKTISVANNFLFIMTTNGGETTADMASRSLLVELFRAGSPLNNKFEILDLIKFVSQNIDDIESELLTYIEIWISKGCLKSSKVSHRFQGWAETVGGVLEANGFEGFLSNQHLHEAESGLAFEFSKCINKLPKSAPMQARYIHGICNTENKYFNSFGPVANFSKKVLMPLLGQEFQLEDKHYALESAGKSSENSALFMIRSLSHAKNAEKAEHSNLLLLTKNANDSFDLFTHSGERRTSND